MFTFATGTWLSPSEFPNVRSDFALPSSMPGPMETVMVWGRCVPGSRTCVVALNARTGESPIDLVVGVAGNRCSSQWSGIRSGRMRLFAVRNSRTGSKSWMFSLWEYPVSGPEGSSCNGLVAICHFPSGEDGSVTYENHGFKRNVLWRVRPKPKVV